MGKYRKKNRGEKRIRVKEKPVCLFYLSLERGQKEEKTRKTEQLGMARKAVGGF